MIYKISMLIIFCIIECFLVEKSRVENYPIYFYRSEISSNKKSLLYLFSEYF